MTNDQEASQTDERLEQVLAEYLHSVEAGQPLDRQQLLQQHPDLADDLQSFFRNRDAMEQLAEPVQEQAPTIGMDAEETEAGGDRVRYFGDYKLVEEIARGGMGVVYRARQVSLNRHVALKMILSGELASEDDVRRFRMEAEAAANLDHTNIVPIYEIGEHEGQHYFSMKLIEGRSLREEMTSISSDVRTAVKLLAQVSRAVHHAHQRGVLHRDLKPGNILIDAVGEPHVTDFGLAKRVEGDSDLTKSGAILGTPNYMAPEQASSEKALSTAADVYSLGAVLYEVLAGQTPFRGESPVETLLQVMTREPQRPRTINRSIDRDLETICLKCLAKEPENRYGSALALAEDLEHWLRGEPILARPTTAWERAAKWARRRPAVAALTALAFLLAVVGVAGIGWQWRAAEAARKDAVAKAAAETAAREDEALARAQADAARLDAEQARDAEAREREKSEYEAYVAQIALAAARIDQGVYGDVEEILDRCPPHLRHWEWGWLKRRCRRHLLSVRHEAAVNCVAISPDGSLLATGSQDGTARVWDARKGTLIATLTGHLHPVNKVLFSEDGTTILTSGMDETTVLSVLDRTDHRSNTVKLWDASTAKEIRSFQGSYQTLSGNGKRVLAVDQDSNVHVWETETGKEIAVVQVGFERKRGNICTFSPDGSRFMAGANVVDPEAGQNGFTGHIWDAETGKEIAALALPLLLLRSAFSPDGKRLLTTVVNPLREVEGKTIVVDTDTGKEVAVLQTPWQWIATFSPQGRRVVTVEARDHLARVFEVETGKQIASWKVPPSRIRSVVYDAEGKRLLTAGDDATARVWNAANGEEIAALKGHSADLSSAVFSPDGQRVLTGSQDRTAKLWNIQSKETVSLRAHPVGVSSIAFSPDGNQVMSARGNMFAHVWNPVSGKELFRLQQGDGSISSAIFSIDGQRVLTKGGRIVSGTSIAPVATVWEVRTGKRLASVEVLQQGESFGINCLAFSPDGRQIVTGGPEPVGKVWDGNSGKQIGTLEGHTEGIHFIAFSADGKRIITADKDVPKRGSGPPTEESGGPDDIGISEKPAPAVRIWDAETRKELVTLPQADHVWYATFSPNRERILVCTRDERMTKFTVKLLDGETGRTITTLPEPDEMGRSFKFFSGGELGSRHKSGYSRLITQPVVFSPDGSRFILIFGGKEGVIPVWDTASGKELMVLRGIHPIHTAVFSPDGKRILTGGIAGKSVWLWDARSGRELLNFPQRTEVTAVAFSPDGRRVLIGGEDGSIEVIPAADYP